MRSGTSPLGTMTSRRLRALILSIATVNLWNRLNATTSQVAGEWEKSPEARTWMEKGHSAPR
jgi:hypothetical protein